MQKKMQPVEGKLDPLPDEGWVNDEQVVDAVTTLRIRMDELRAAGERLDAAIAERDAAHAEKVDREKAVEQAKAALLKAAVA